MLIDLLIIILGVSAVYRGKSVGFVRQLCSTAGFFGGLLFGIWITPHVIKLIHGTEARSIFTVAVVLGSALVFSTVGELLGIRIKRHVRARPFNALDNGLGSGISLVSLLIGIWLMASLVNTSSLPALQTAVRSSRIINQLNRMLPPAPSVIAQFSHLINPNGFPDVFIDNEPVPEGNLNLPALGDLADAVKADRQSVVRIEGQGCGGIVSGSGFVVRPGLVATNAHVVAGIARPFVQDANGGHGASVVYFDPNLDFAILRVNGLTERSLGISNTIAARGTPAAVLGYPGGGNFVAKPAVVLRDIRAAGRNIYGGGYTLRDVYEVQADIVPGNSGGPLVDKSGKVIGVVFAESTTYNEVGYTLTTVPLNQAISQAAATTQSVNHGRCAE